MKSYYLGQDCIVYNLSDKLSLSDNLKVLKIYKNIFKDIEFRDRLGIHDVVPAYNSIAFYFNNYSIENIDNILRKKIESIDLSKEIPYKEHTIYVNYNGEDLEMISEKLKIHKKDIIDIHTSGKYHIAMLGFMPYLPYLLGLDTRISVPRLDKPRNRIAKGSVGIGGSQTTIFPEQTPSGWNIIGNTDFNDFKSFSAGDKIYFREV